MLTCYKVVKVSTMAKQRKSDYGQRNKTAFESQTDSS